MNTPCNEFFDFVNNYCGEKINLCFDIGSRDCNESVALQKLLNCKVVAFEPNPPQYNICKTYEDENIKVEPIALSNYEGRSSFYQTPANVGAASLLKPLMVPHSWDNTIIKIEDIEVTNLSNYCKKNKQYPEMIWMDVQGNELNVLLGMDQEVINNLQYICTEVGVVGYYEGHTLENDIKNLLNSFGFHLIFEKFEWEKEKFCIFKKRS